MLLPGAWALDDCGPDSFISRSNTAIAPDKVAIVLFVCHSGNKYLQRTAIACVALLQMGSTVALTHADALLDGERMGTPDHFESPENTDCPFQHDHLFCQVVRSVSHATASPEITAETGPAPPILYVEADFESGVLKRAPILFGAVSPRGPPVI